MGHDPSRGDPQKLRGHATLTLRNPLIENALAAANFDENYIQQAAMWGNVVLRARDDWADQYRRGRRYSDATADRHQHSLGWQKRGRQ
jgi:hypothetical protein